MNPVWANEIYIGTAATSATPPVWTYDKLCKGIESVSFASNEQNQQYFFLCGNGFAHNEVTGAAPALTISGRRIKGDAAQDYIAGQFKLLEFEEYCYAVAEMIKIIGKETAIERFSGESPSEMLIAPDWCGERDRIIAKVEEFLSA